MNCCTTIRTDTGRLFSWFAALHRLRFRLLGFEKTQRQLIDGIEQAGVSGAELLEIGCGPGYLHHSLLQSGAARATGVDLAEGMLTEARSASRAAGLNQCTDYRLGDFVELAEEIRDADITILDKVICCYPEWQILLDRSLEKTRRVYALTYPRNRYATRAGVRAMHWLLSLFRCCYQPYIHDPEQIRKRIHEHGFYLTHAVLTTAWHTQVYSRR